MTTLEEIQKQMEELFDTSTEISSNEFLEKSNCLLNKYKKIKTIERNNYYNKLKFVMVSLFILK